MIFRNQDQAAGLLEPLTAQVNAPPEPEQGVLGQSVRDHLARERPVHGLLVCEPHGVPRVHIAAVHAIQIHSPPKKKVLIKTANAVPHANQVVQEPAAHEAQKVVVLVLPAAAQVAQPVTQLVQLEREVQLFAAQEEQPKKTKNKQVKRKEVENLFSLHKQIKYPEFVMNSGYFLLRV